MISCEGESEDEADRYDDFTHGYENDEWESPVVPVYFEGEYFKEVHGEEGKGAWECDKEDYFGVGVPYLLFH